MRLKDFYFLRSTIMEIKIEPPMSKAIIPSDQLIGNFPPKALLSQTILRPTKTRTEAKPYLIKANLCMTPASIKYIERRPKMAKIFEVKTMRGSFEIAKIAGTESTEKIMSLSSRKTSAKKSGVT